MHVSEVPSVILPLEDHSLPSSNSSQDIGHFLKMPEELILTILQYLNYRELTAVRLINHKFYRLASDHSLVTKEATICQKFEKDCLERIAKERNQTLSLNWKSKFWGECPRIIPFLTERLNTLPLYSLPALAPFRLQDADPPILQHFHRGFKQKIVDTWVKHLQGLKELILEKNWNFQNESFELFLKAFEKISNGLHLIIRCPLNQQQMEMLGQALKDNRMQLTQLSIENQNQMDPKFTQLLFEGLKENHTIEQLKLAFSPIRDCHISLLKKSLKTNKSLKKLDIDCCHMTPRGIGILTELLEQNDSLKDLKISGVDGNQTQVLIEGIDCSHLNSLCVINANLSDPNAQLLAEKLETNPELKILQLSPKNIEALEKFLSSTIKISLVAVNVPKYSPNL